MNSLLNHLLDKISVGVILIDTNLNIVFWNQSMIKKTNLNANEVLDHPLTTICPRFEEPYYKEILQGVIENGHGRFISGAVHGTFFNKDDETELPIRQNMQIEYIDNEESHYILIQVHDVTNHHQKVQKMLNFIKVLETENDEIRKTEEKARLLSLTDPLTELMNRSGFNEQLKALKNPLLNHSSINAVVFLDLDGFKDINDTYGHAAGDYLLIETAKRLKSALRSTDILARIGGDEFAMIIGGIHNTEDVIHIADKILHSFIPKMFFDGNEISVTCSFGISLMPIDGTDPLDLLDKADLALYRVKKSGKGGFALFSNRTKIFR